jgi:hypothetical protein
VLEALKEMTGGIGPDCVIDCVGMESHGLAIDNLADTVKQQLMLATERPACASSGDHRLPQGRQGARFPAFYGGFRRQVSARPDDGKGSDGEDRPDPRASATPRSCSTSSRRTSSTPPS